MFPGEYARADLLGDCHDRDVGVAADLLREDGCIDHPEIAAVEAWLRRAAMITHHPVGSSTRFAGPQERSVRLLYCRDVGDAIREPGVMRRGAHQRLNVVAFARVLSQYVSEADGSNFSDPGCQDLAIAMSSATFAVSAVMSTYPIRL